MIASANARAICMRNTHPSATVWVRSSAASASAMMDFSANTASVARTRS